MTQINYKSLEVDGIDTKDYPDFSDAYFCYGEYADGTPLTDEALEKLTENGDLLYEHIHSAIY
jgi:hypothetical protein